MTTKLTHPYFGVLDITSLQDLDEDDYDVLWEQEIPYKDSIVLVALWFTKNDTLSKERLDAFETFLNDLAKKEVQAREALKQYLEDDPNYLNHFREKTHKATDDIETFINALEMDMLDLWYPQEEAEADVDMYFAPYYGDEDILEEEVISVKFALSGEILSIDWDE